MGDERATRPEHDSMGTVYAPADCCWGAQTQRSRENFPIGVGHETMPEEIVRAFGLLKLAAARVNHELLPEKMTEEKLAVIGQAPAGVLALFALEGAQGPPVRLRLHHRGAAAHPQRRDRQAGILSLFTFSKSPFQHCMRRSISCRNRSMMRFSRRLM